MRPSTDRRGSALLEVIAGLLLLLSAGLSLVSLLRQAATAERAAAGREHLVWEADRVLSAMTLISRTDLTRRIGRHEIGEFHVEVRRPEPALFRIGVREARAPEIELLATVVYRAAP